MLDTIDATLDKTKNFLKPNNVIENHLTYQIIAFIVHVMCVMVLLPDGDGHQKVLYLYCLTFVQSVFKTYTSTKYNRRKLPP